MILIKTNRYGAKNFYKELGLSQNFTIAGLFRRWERQYPRLMKTTKLGMIFLIVTSSSMLVLPGTDLPFQEYLKRAVCKKAQQIFKFWYIHAGVPDISSYTLVLYRILFYQLSQGIYSPQMISYYMSRVNTVFKPQDIQVYRVKDASRLQNLSVKRFELSLDHDSLLKNPIILSQYQSIVDNSVLAVENQIQQKNKKDYGACLKLFEYLLKFEPKQNRSMTLDKLITLLDGKNKKFVSMLLINNDQLKKQLKFIYSQDQDNQAKIIQILKLTEQARKLSIS